jgi:hypothetical protein
MEVFDNELTFRRDHSIKMCVEIWEADSESERTARIEQSFTANRVESAVRGR